MGFSPPREKYFNVEIFFVLRTEMDKNKFLKYLANYSMKNVG